MDEGFNSGHLHDGAAVSGYDQHKAAALEALREKDTTFALIQMEDDGTTAWISVYAPGDPQRYVHHAFGLAQALLHLGFTLPEHIRGQGDDDE